MTITVTDDGFPPFNFTRTFYFNVTDVNEPPKNISISIPSVREDAQPGDIVSVITANNPEKDETIDYEIVAINGVKNSTEFYVGTDSSETTSYLYLNRSLDYETESSFAIEILATDRGRLSAASAYATIVVDVRRADPCATGLAGCSENATCYRVDQSTSECVCLMGYIGDGKDCREINECVTLRIDDDDDDDELSSRPLCVHGECIDKWNGYTCRCDSGYIGFDCSVDAKMCAMDLCGGGGNCTDLTDGFGCSCFDGYAGLRCENFDDCAASPCQRGTCVDGVSDFRCECPPDYAGDLCSFSTTACSASSCSREQTCVPKTTTSGFHCVDTASKVVSVPFSNDIVDSKDFQLTWERFVRQSLNDSAATVYIVREYRISELETNIYFVVLYDDEAEEAQSVLITLKKLCADGEMNTTLGYSMAEGCEVPTPTTKGSPQEIVEDPPSQSLNLWIVAVALLSLGSVLFVTTLFAVRFRKAQLQKRRKRRQRRDSSAWIGPSPASRYESFVRNPLYKEDGDGELADDVYVGYDGVVNPLYDCDTGLAPSAAVHTYTNPMFNEFHAGVWDNPVYEASAPVGEENCGDMDNPVYDSANKKEDGEGIYDDPRDCE